MGSHFYLLFVLVFVAVTILTVPVVLGATRSGPKMNGEINDASEITWAHAVNSWDALEKALNGPVDFLEADISLGSVKGNEGYLPIPIMAHPPDTTSDISLDTWLSTVAAKKPDKGIKLDFKSLDALEPSLVLLKKYSTKLNSSVWLNADVLPGPVNSATNPVEVEAFLSLCQLYFPNATLSIGWTTHWYPTFVKESWQYGWQHVRKMADVIRCKGYGNFYPNFTFPVRGIFLSRSIKQFQWLLSIIPNSTLTVWTGKYDPLKIEGLLRIRSSFPKNRVYYDIPENIGATFREKKDTVVPTSYDFSTDNVQWMTLTKGKGETCSTLTYVKNDTIVFGKSLTTAVLMKNLILLKESDNLRLTGKIIFYDTGDQFVTQANAGMQELSIILADVSLFTKDSPEHSEKEFDLNASDTEVIWSAINSSIIYTFRHKYTSDGSENIRDSEDATCRLFKLDTSEDKSFEVWTVPCDAMLEESPFEELSRNGIPDISSRKRLVLPKGPFMLGFMSSGDTHVTIYDMKLKGHKEAFSAGLSSLNTPLSLTTMIISLIFILCILF